MKKDYWEDEEYKSALDKYSEYNQRCYALNPFNPSDSEMFRLRDECALKMKKINIQ